MPNARWPGPVAPRLVLMGLTLAVGAGCRPSNGRTAVSGQVVFKQGAPIKRGSIEFSPLDGGDVHGGARIADGRYAIAQEKGLKPGKYLVRIYAPAGLLSATGAPGAGGPGQAAKLPEETVSPKYNVDSQLRVEVGSAAAQEFDFAVE